MQASPCSRLAMRVTRHPATDRCTHEPDEEFAGIQNCEDTMIRLVMADRVRLVCEVIGAALEGEPDIHVVGIATTEAMAYEQATEADANMALISTSLPDGGALRLVQRFREDAPHVKVLVTGLAATESVIMRYIEAGAAGYVLRDDSVDELLRNIRAAFEEKALVSPEVAARLMQRIAELNEQLADLGIDPTEYQELTPREKEILDLIADGLTNQEIAETLTIEVGTVKNHVHNILSKLNVNSRQDAAMVLALFENEETEETDDDPEEKATA